MPDHPSRDHALPPASEAVAAQGVPRKPITVALLAAVAVSVLVGLVATLLGGPRPPAIPEHTSGDAALAARVTGALGDHPGVHALAAAEISGDRVTFTGLGDRIGSTTPFETGSLMKPITGMLLADAARRGEVRTDQSADSIVPGAGAATLQELSTHHSGMPGLPRDPASIVRTAWASASAGNPYGSTRPATVLDAARRAEAPGGKDFSYSNLGVSVLGQLLAVKLGRPYPDLVRERILAPLGMTSTTLHTGVPDGGAAPAAANGRAQSAWYGTGFAPAGIGWWTTAADLTRLVRAAMAGTAPGATATRPIAPADGDDRRIGLGWITETEPGGQAITWHNGGTGGTRTFMGYDPRTRHGVVLLATTSSDAVDQAGFRLLSP